MNRSLVKADPSYQITCYMDNEAAALERLCRVIRVRGFRVETMNVELCEHNQLCIQVLLRGERAIGMLRSQLEKLHTVTHVIAEQQLRSRQTA